MKQFTVAGHILKRPITVIMVTLIVIGFGVFSLTNLKVTLYPTFNIPVLAISTSYKDVAPQDMQRIVVEPLEGAVSSIEGIQTLESNISKGSAFIILRLNNGVNIRNTELKVRQAISRVRNQLPAEAADPVIFQFDPNDRPIMNLSLTASNRGLDELRQLGTEFIEPRLERLDGVASADTRGGLERQIYIDVDPASLAQYNLVPSDIETALRNNNSQVPIGNIITKRNSFSIRAQSLFTNIDDIKQTIIKNTDSGVPIRISDVAKVQDGFAEINTLVEINGQNSVSVEVQKKSDANTLSVANAVKNEIPAINASLPPGVSLQVLTSEGDNIQNSISNLAESAFAALFVVVIILLLFMGGWRVALVVAITIPVSVTATFAGMFAAGLTLNILTISALALAIGLLVDNAIVVSESIARKLEEGHSKFDAALQGTNEVIGALMGATFTTLGVFIPIISLSGVQAQFFVDFAITISIAISISFVASIILVPVIAAMLMSKEESQKQTFATKMLGRIETWYVSSLRWIMFRKWMVVVFVALLMIGSYIIYTHMPSEFLAQSDSGQLEVNVELPTGTKLVRTAQIMRGFSQQLRNMKEVKTVIDKMGSQGFRSETNGGRITVNLVDQSKRKVTTAEFSLRLRRVLQAPGVDVRIQLAGNRGFGGGFGQSGIRLSLVGPDVDVLQAISDKIENEVLADSNVISVDNGRTDPTPELHYLVNRERINRMQSSLSQVANSLKTQVQGTRVGYFIQEGRQIPIEVRVSKNLLTNRQDIFNLQLIQVGDQRVPVSALGHFESVKGVNRIQRRDRETVLDVNIDVKGNAQAYRQKIINTIQRDVVLPDGYRYEFTGGTRQARQSSSEISIALLFAMMLTYMIMASLFENFRDPFVIFFTIPLAFFGALLGLFVTNTPIGSTAYIGMFILVGIIVNNGIVLVDYMHLYTKNNEYSNSLFNNVIEACRRRMRPILLTALTTICSMIPLSLGIGTGANIWSPLARAVIGGLFFGTLLTLYVIPVFVMGVSKKRRQFIKDEAEKQA